jgi:hypothetical protein
VPAAVGPRGGTVTIFASDNADESQIASCSPKWLAAVKSSGRFAGHEWSKRVEVPMTTLDRLVAAHGRPALCKIDVEGFELDVLRGLTTPIPLVSFEFSPETIERACECAAYLARLGSYRFNYAALGYCAFGLAASLPFVLFRQAMRELPPAAMKWGGDVYAWCDNNPARAA